MKLILVLFNIVLLLSSYKPLSAEILLEPQTAVIAGRITNPLAKQVWLTYSKTSVFYDKVETTIALDKNNEFEIVLNTPEPKVVSFRPNRNTLKLFIEPGDRLWIEVDMQNFTQSLAFSGQGADNNRFWNEMTYEFPNQRITYKNLSLGDFRQIVDSRRDGRITFLVENREKYELTSAFLDYCLAEINYEWALFLNDYPRRYLHANGANPHLPPDYFGFVDEVGLVDESALSSENYIYFLRDFLGKIAFEESKRRFKKGLSPRELEEIQVYVLQYELAKEKLSGKVKYLFQANRIISGYLHTKTEMANELFEEYRELNPYPEYTEVIERVRGGVKKLGLGKPAPDFTLTDLNGQPISLGNFKGSIVFLDFWASWCAPCVANLPFINVIKYEMQGKNVVFLNVSLDKNENAWRKAINNKGIKGVNVRANGFTSDVAKNYDVTFIPKYFLIDQAGNVAEYITHISETEAIVTKMDELLSKN